MTHILRVAWTIHNVALSLKALYGQDWNCVWKLIIFPCGFSLSMTCIFIQKNNEEVKFCALEEQWYLPPYWSDKGLNCTVLNRASYSLHKGLLEITTPSLKL